MPEGPTISTHVLDAETGRPRQGVVVQVSFLPPDSTYLDEPERGITDEDGRVGRLTDRLLRTDGHYMITFRVEGPFFQEISISFQIDDPSRSYHVPLLLAPYSLTTYRGS
jgi:5-hydroxyisourate hydrolase